MDWMTPEEQKKTLIAAGTGYVGLAGIKSTADELGNRSRIASYPNNFLKGFYGGGKLNQAAAFGEEVLANTVPIMRDIVDPRTSYAYKKTGLSTRGYGELMKLEADNKNLRNNMQRLSNKEDSLIETDVDNSNKKQLQRVQSEFKDKKRQLASSQKKQHYKIINDYSNRYLYNKNPGKVDDVARYAKQFVTKIDNVSDAQRIMGNSPKAMAYIAEAHGITNLKNAVYLKHTMPPKTGDVLRGIQFDPKVFRLFGKMNELDSFDNLKREQVIKMAKSVGLSVENEASATKLFFRVSPRGKPNYDWGGYSGVIEWNPENKGKVKFHASDKRDLFGMKLGGKNVLNVVEPKTITIPEVITKISNDHSPKRRKEIEKIIERHPKAPELKKMIANNYSPGNNISHDKQITKILNHHKSLMRKNPFSKKLLNPTWLIRRGSIGLTIAGTIMLGLALKDQALRIRNEYIKDRETAQ